MLEQSWTGRRVSVRRAVARTASGELQFADVVGDLMALRADTAVVETRDGLVEIPTGHVVAARVVEASTADILALEDVCARGWRAAETHRLGGWLLRANEGFTGRANSVLPLTAPGTNLTDALEEARAWYAARGLPLRLQLPLQARSLLDGELGERGFAAVQPDVSVFAARLDAVAAGTDPRVSVTDAPDADWLAGYDQHPAARALLTRHPAARFAAVREGGRAVAIARAAVDEGWVGITALRVAESHRRRGLASAVVRTLFAAAPSWGAARVYLQVSAGNGAGLALVSALGCWHHHDYRYRYEPTAADAMPRSR